MTKTNRGGEIPPHRNMDNEPEVRRVCENCGKIFWDNAMDYESIFIHPDLCNICHKSYYRNFSGEVLTQAKNCERIIGKND